MTAGRGPLGRAVLDVVLYTVARLLLVVVLSAVVYGLGRLIGLSDFPPIIAMLLALIIALPLGMWLFAPLRRRANASLALAGERRRKERAELRARLRGDIPSEAD